MGSINVNQLKLPIRFELSYSPDNYYVCSANKYAYDWLEKWPSEIKENFVCLVGDDGCGKTHLSHIWEKQTNAQYFSGDCLKPDVFMTLQENKSQNKCYVFDDLDKIDDSLFLFYLFNTIKERGDFLLFTAKTPPSVWNLDIADTASRFSTAHVLDIATPNETDLKEIIIKMLEQRGLTADLKVVEYIYNNVDRTYFSVEAFVNKIFASGNKVNISGVKPLA